MSKELARGNHEVTIITTDIDFDQQYADTIRAEGVTVIVFPCIINIEVFLYSPSMKIWSEKHLKEFDIIHLHNYRSYQNIIIRSFAKRYGIPYVLQAHGSVLLLFEKKTLKKLYDFFWGNKILNDAAKLIAVSTIEKEQYLKMGIPENKIVTIENGIDISKYTTLPQQGKFRERYGIEPEKKIILYLGRLHKRKGIDFLVDGFSKITDQNVLLVIVGPDDGYREGLIQRIQSSGLVEKVLMVGQVSEQEKIEAYVDADVLVYPGRLEIFGLVPFEAIMCGTPVIVADDCGCGEIMNRERCGLFVKFGNADDLKDRIKRILDNPDESRALLANGQAFIQKNLIWADLIKKFETVYNQ